MSGYGWTKCNRVPRFALLGPVLVEGGPGSGKGRTLSARVAVLLNTGASPRSIFYLTPNPRRARQIRQTIAAQLPLISRRVTPEQAGAVQVASLRGFAETWLRYIGPQSQGITADFTLWSDQHSEQVMEQLLLANHHGSGISLDVRDILRLHRYRRSSNPQLDVPGVPPPWTDLIAEYEMEKRRQNALDPEDLVYRSIETAGNKPEDLRAWRDRAKPHLMVDDFQNLTRAEYLFLKTLVGSNGSLTVAGDRNRRIGTYRGADRELFDLFLRENPSAKHFRPLANYRLTQPLHDLAVALLPTAAPDGAEPGTVVPRLPKGQTSILIRFPGTPDEMGQSIAGLLTGYRAHGSSWGDIAVLCRRRSSVDRLSKSLSARGIPCRVWGDDRRQGRESSQHELTISTFHAAQGQQWDKVVIEDASDDMVPGSLDLSNQDWLQEERRLLYVAVTRAAKTLAIFCCTKGGEGTESRFLTMGNDVLDRMS